MSRVIEWFEYNASMAWNEPVVLNEMQRRAVNTIDCILGFAHLGIAGNLWHGGIRLLDDGLDLLVRRNLSTYDDSSLTDIVMAAHENRVRVQIGPWYPHLDEARREEIIDHLNYEFDCQFDPEDIEFHCMNVILNARQEHGAFCVVHPGLKELQVSLTK